MKTLIFVSHSSADNTLTAEVCKQLKALLGGDKNCEVLVDTEKLEEAHPWPIQLHEMMADCHAAVVLLSEKALKSDWVRKEMTILTWRNSLQPDFKLFIAQFPGITDEQLKHAGYEPLQHRQIQGINSADPGVIAARVHARLQADAVAPVQTLFDRLAEHLGALLRQADAQSLDELARKLGAERPRWRPETVPKTALVEKICRQILRGELGQFSDLTELFNNLKTRLPPHNLKQILKLLAPHWVDAQSAGHLGNLVAKAGGKLYCRAAAINGNHAKLYTGRMYLYRAFPLESQYRLHSPNPPAAGNVVEHYRKAICEICRQEDDEYRAMGDNEDAIINDLAADVPWLFVVISPLDHKALKELQTLFPTVRFVLDVGPQHEGIMLPDGVARLLPPVDTAVEEKRRSDYRQTQKILKEVTG